MASTGFVFINRPVVVDAPGLACFDSGGFQSVMDYMSRLGLVVNFGDRDRLWVGVVMDQDFDFFRQIFDIAVGVDGGGSVFNWDIVSDYNGYGSKVDRLLSPGVRRRLILEAMYSDGYRVAVDTFVGAGNEDVRYISVIQFLRD